MDYIIGPEEINCWQHAAARYTLKLVFISMHMGQFDCMHGLTIDQQTIRNFTV